MSNNKQSMKLYTEEQVRKLLNEILMLSSSVNDAMDSLTPIELPSDEEIWNKSDEEESNSKHYAFTRGAKWMRDKIQGGNNEQKAISETASTNTAKGFWVKDLKIQGGNNE